MNYTLHIVICAVLLLTTIGLYLYRRWLENHEDHYIHLHNDSHDSAIIETQATMCKRCETVDKIKYATLTATILYALAIAGMATYEAWVRANSSI
jgi:late competence protein required for DNA uptake (superfamily II DNA/RNA helicase)